MKIILKKIKLVDIEIIQSELLKFIRHKVDNITHCKDYEKYCNDIVVIDTLQSIFYLFRKKIESNRPIANISLSPTQSVILLYCCQWERIERSQELQITLQLISDSIHQELTNIN